MRRNIPYYYYYYHYYYHYSAIHSLRRVVWQNLTVLLLAAALALGSAKSPAGSLLFDTPRPPVVNSVIKNVDVDLCPTCIRFTEKALNILLNIIVREYGRGLLPPASLCCCFVCLCFVLFFVCRLWFDQEKGEVGRQAERPL